MYRLVTFWEVIVESSSVSSVIVNKSVLCFEEVCKEEVKHQQLFNDIADFPELDFPELELDFPEKLKIKTYNDCAIQDPQIRQNTENLHHE